MHVTNIKCTCQQRGLTRRHDKEAGSTTYIRTPWLELPSERFSLDQRLSILKSSLYNCWRGDRAEKICIPVLHSYVSVGSEGETRTNVETYSYTFHMWIEGGGGCFLQCYDISCLNIRVNRTTNSHEKSRIEIRIIHNQNQAAFVASNHYRKTKARGQTEALRDKTSAVPFL